ncbi:MAG: hypothetical protein P4L31_05930, partial [Candidatus Babeliales bacterium]|nr:hypothetical protein [Candidatus Babeliales bacterium]
MKRISIFVMGMCCLLSHDGYAANDTIGSDTAVSVLAAHTFSAANTNRIATFGLVLNGFTLQNSATSVTVDTIFPVSGNITLNGGTIVLDKDFKMFNPL